MNLTDLKPHQREQVARDLEATWRKRKALGGINPPSPPSDAPAPAQKPKKPLLNKTEQRCRDILAARGYQPILEQAITLRLDPPFKSYTPDLAYVKGTYLTLVEVKGPHRFREKGIAKAALAAKTYPMFRFELFDWTKDGWKESVLSP